MRILIVVLSLVLWCSSTAWAEDPAPAKEEAPEAVALSQDGVKEYSCPMHPDAVQNEPGFCPICNMALTESEPAPSDAVSLLEEKVAEVTAETE